MDERFRSAVGFPPGTYLVSSLGRVFSVRRRRFLRGSLGSSGYRRVRLTAPGRPTRTLYVHRLVAEAFLGPAPAGHVVGHKSGRKTDNSVLNLTWTTRRDSARNAARLGLLRPTRPGEQNARAKLTADQVRAIRAERRARVPLRVLSRRYGVSTSTVSRAATGKAWGHLDDFPADSTTSDLISN